MPDLKEKYHKGFLNDKASGRKDLDERVFNTIDRLFKHVLKKEFKGKVIDIGCGDGGFVNCLNSHNIEAGGVDINHGINFEQDKLPYKDDEFDIAFMNSVIEHLADPSNILDETKRILKNDGLLVIITPNLDQVKSRFYDDPTHAKPYNPRSIVWLMNLFNMKKEFVGLWTVNKSILLWKMPENIQFLIGKLLPFTGLNEFAPGFLKGRSETMLAVFRSEK